MVGHPGKCLYDEAVEVLLVTAVDFEVAVKISCAAPKAQYRGEEHMDAESH